MYSHETVISALQKIPLSLDDFWLIMGAALVMHRIRDTCADIDLGCSQFYAQSLLRRGYATCPTLSGYTKVILGDSIHLYGGWVPSELELIDGFLVSSLASIRTDKLRLGRPKDLSDVALIEARMLAHETD